MTDQPKGTGAPTIMETMQAAHDAVPLDVTDPSHDLMGMFRDPKDNPARAPGPINIQRTVGGLAFQGIPTFFRAPVALCPEDLVAGGVDVAIMGASVDQSVGLRGTAWAPQAMRTAETLIPWGAVLEAGHPVVGDVDFTRVLKLVDYGDAPVDPMSVERSIVPVHAMVREIAQSGAIPVIIGGDHSLMYPDVVAVTDVHGKGEVGVIHFDAHFDAVGSMFGHKISNGSVVRRLIEEGHVHGRNFVQIGLQSFKPSAGDLAWMRENELRYHFMAEIERDGWRSVLDRALAEALDGPRKVFISLDIDVLDLAVAPGSGTPEPGGMTVRELFPMLRAIGVQHEVVGFELVEVNPLLDQTFRTRLTAIRIVREVLTGIAMRRLGMTDPQFEEPRLLHHGVRPRG